MAENGINGYDRNDRIQWKVGLINNAFKYLTAESFGFKVNATGATLKKKQIWSIEQEPSKEFVYIRSFLGRYISSDKYGTVTVEAEEASADEKFLIEYSKDEVGKWAFKHVTYGNYFSGIDDQVKCFDKTIIDKNWWSIQLYVHPQIHLRNVNRKRYAHLNKESNELECTEIIPWGADSLMFLDFVNGKYILKSGDNRVLNCDGSLQNDVDASTLFSLEIHSGSLAFKDTESRYLTAVGKGTLKVRNTTVSKDELFTIENSHPQVQIVSHNGKCVSIKQGVDVSANQPTEQIGDTEIFQMEYCKSTDTWSFRTSTNTFWNFQTLTGTVQATMAETTKDSYFKIDWQKDGTVGIKASDCKYLSNRQTGILYTTGPNFEDTNRFRVIIVNRPLLVLKSEFGFVGLKGNQYICNKVKYDILCVSSVGNGTYTIKGSDGKFWNVAEDKMIYSEDNPTKFQFQFYGGSLLAIRASNNLYLKGEQNGLFKAVSEDINAASMWEF